MKNLLLAAAVALIPATLDARTCEDMSMAVGLVATLQQTGYTPEQVRHLVRIAPTDTIHPTWYPLIDEAVDDIWPLLPPPLPTQAQRDAFAATLEANALAQCWRLTDDR